MAVRLLSGDCRVTLPTLEPGSIQACITSPPYYGLRDYGLPPLVWGGLPGFPHVFGSMIAGDNRGGSGTPTNKNGRGENYGRDAERGQFCQCGAWLGSLGLEPTPDCGRTEVSVRRDLTPKQRAYVVKRLKESGLM